MRADTAIRLRISNTLKEEWQKRARADGVSLSHVLRTAGRLGMIIGPGRLQEAVTTLDAIRRDLHAANAELKGLCATNTAIEPGRVRAAVASVNEAADAVSAFLRMR